MSLVDTHCHIHAAIASRTDFTAKKWQDAGETDPDLLIESAKEAGVDKLICVGTDLADSEDAVEFAQDREGCWATVGIHPHDAKQFLVRASSSPSAASEREGIDPLDQISNLINQPKVVAIGEVGLDYYYEHSPKQDQIKLLEMFLELARKYELPVIFHVRDAFDDFWPILANFEGLRGVLHSFTADMTTLDKALNRGLYIGLNGIMTFTRDENQLQMAKNVPLERLLLETDSPYLAPKPFRGKINKPTYICEIAEFLSQLRGEKFEDLAQKTTMNTGELFKI